MTNTRLFEIRVSGDFARSPELLPALCLACATVLDIDPAQGWPSERRLGTCGACGAWHRVDRTTDGPDALIAVQLLPACSALEDSIVSSPRRAPGLILP